MAACSTLLAMSCKKEELIEEKTLEENVSSTVGRSKFGAFLYGINGHPVNQAAYTDIGPKAQVDLLKRNGMNIYRVDFPLLKSGDIRWDHRLINITNTAKDAGVQILPIIPPSTLNINHSEKEAYWQAYHLTQKFMWKYGKYFTHFELANELDNRCILSRWHTGNLKEHYDLKKFRTIASYLRGMNNAVKDINPRAKTIINVSWLHYRFLTMLDEYGVKYDIAGYHWYQDQETTAKNDRGIDDITKTLNKHLKKPIWFTEVGYRDFNGNASDEDAKKFLNSFIQKCYNNKQVEAIMLYELFDQPYFKSQEGRFGIYKWLIPHSQFAAKAFAN